MIVRTTRVLLEVLAASLLGIMLLTGGAAWRLSQGPVPLNFLSPHFEAALNGQGAPFRVTLEKTILAWAGWERTLDIRIVDVRDMVRTHDGRQTDASTANLHHSMCGCKSEQIHVGTNKRRILWVRACHGGD